MIEQKYLAGLNSDDSDRDLQHFLRDCLNLVPQVGGRGDSPRRESLKGTRQVTNVLPSGANITVGTFEDKNKERVFFFNYNDAGNHGLYMYVPIEEQVYTILESSELNFTDKTVISGAGIIQDTLLWTDGVNPPRSIDVERGATFSSGKSTKEWELIYNESVYGVSVILSLVTNSGTVLKTLPTITDNDSASIDSWVTAINTIAGVTAEKCGNAVSIKEDTEDTITSISSSSSFLELAPVNFYPSFNARSINLANQPPLCEPNPVFSTDELVKSNFLENKQFQFRTRFVYFDNTKSVLSPISELAFSKTCGGGTSVANNCIDVNFEHDTYDQISLSLVKNVEVYFREGNLGDWYLADSLDRIEYFAGSYKFCNNGIYKILDTETSNKLSDSVPLVSNALSVLKNRVFLGGNLEGYDTPCIDANITVDLEDVDANVQPNTWSIKGDLRIVNGFMNSAFTTNPILHAYAQSQPIYSSDHADDLGEYVFGGYAVSNEEEEVGIDYKQYIPQGGFTVYLAGTNYRATSTQVSSTGLDGGVDNPVVSKNTTPLVHNGEGATNIENIKSLIEDIDAFTTQPVNRARSEFEIKDVPPGKYYLRVASHLVYEGTTPSHIDDPDNFYQINDSLNWQKTSTNLYDIGFSKNSSGSPAYTAGQETIEMPLSDTLNPAEIFPTNNYEILIELDENGGVHTLSDVITVADLTEPQGGDNSVANQIYFIDSNGTQSDADFKNSKPITGATVEHSNVTGVSGHTDHNGYWFFAEENQSIFTPDIKANSSSFVLRAYGDSTVVNGVNISHVRNGSASTITADSEPTSTQNEMSESIVFAKDSSIRDNGRTRVVGSVVDSNGNSVAGALVTINGTSEHQVTDSAGGYDILVYSETLPYPERRSLTILVNGLAGGCFIVGDYAGSSSKTVVSPIIINSTNYNNGSTDYYTVPGSSTISVSSTGSGTFLKRGGTYQYGIEYLDEYLRSSLVSTDISLKINIPSYTEDLGIALPDLYPSTGTFRYGNPIVDWEVTSVPPTWAKKWRWVRTKNTAYEDYLHWTAHVVTYATSWHSGLEPPALVPTTYSNGDAREIYIGMNNLISYSDRNSDSKLGYTFNEGDRITIIYNNGAYLTEYLDVPVKATRDGYIVIEYTTSLPELFEGMQFQVYTPKLSTDLQIYYEVGECFDIVNGFHEGDIRTQNVSQSALGRFNSGDTYKISRTINNATTITTSTFDSASILDSIETKDQSIGRATLVNKDFKQENFFSTVRFSNPYIQDTFINGIKTFDSLNDEALPYERGIIRAMVGTDNTILVLHETEATTLYIGEAYVNTGEGSQFLTKTDKVIGDENLLQGEFGTINPESVVEYNDTIFWWDNNKAEPVMYSNNGIAPLGSLRKMRNHFLNVKKTRDANLIANPQHFSRVYGGYDPEKKIFMLSFNRLSIDLNERPTDLEAETIAYNDDKNYWASRLSFNPQHFVKSQNKLFSFKNGDIWEHDVDDVNHNTFYGSHFPCGVTLVSNDRSEMEKIYRHIGIKSSKAFNVPEISNAEGQLSDLVIADFQQRDEVYYADILRDLNTNPATLVTGQIPLRSGDVMRSQTMSFRLETSELGEVLLDYVVFDYQDSPGHFVSMKR